MHKNINWIVFLVSLLWVFGLDIPIMPKVVLFIFQFAMVYVTFFSEIKIRSYWAFGFFAVFLFLASINVYASWEFITLFWPSLLCYPIVIVLISVKFNDKIKNLLVIIQLIILYKYSINTYTFIAQILNNERRWIVVGLIILEMLLFLFIPILFYNQLNRKKISFDLEIAKFMNSLRYLVILVVICHVFFFLVNHRLIIPKVTNYKEIFITFGATLLTTALIEEFLFRGFLFNELYIITKSIKKSIIVSSLLFGMIHFQFGIAFTIFSALVGYILSDVYRRTDSLLYPILIHTLLNVYLQFGT